MSATENTNPSTTKPKKETKPKKVKVDKFNGFKVPARSSARHKSTPWAYHVYDIIKEAKPALLEREDVKVAYNNFVECLLKYEETDPNYRDYGLTSWVPSKNYRYTMGIKPDGKVSSYGSYITDLPFRVSYIQYGVDRGRDETIREKTRKAYEDVINVYTILYDLIKRDVVPFIEIKAWEVSSKDTVNGYHRYMEHLEGEIKRWEAAIADNHRKIGEFAAKCVALQTPPEVTKFD